MNNNGKDSPEDRGTANVVEPLSSPPPLTPDNATCASSVSGGAPVQESVGGAFGLLWPVTKMVLGGRLVEAHGIALHYRRYWMVVAGAIAGSVGLMFFGFTVAAARGIDALFSGIFGASARAGNDAIGTGLKSLILGLLIAALYILARIGAAYVALRFRRVQVPFTAAATVWAVAYTPWLFAALPVAVLALIPTTVTGFLALFVLLLAIPLMIQLGEIGIYVGSNRLAPMARSLALPHTLFNALTLFGAGLGTWIFMELFVG